MLLYFQFSTGAGYLLDSVFDFAERFNELNLTDDEVALFSALVIISSGNKWLNLFVSFSTQEVTPSVIYSI